MKRLAVAIIHGMTTEEKLFSTECKHKIRKYYVAKGENRLEDDLVFHEIYWADAVKDEFEQFYVHVDSNKDLDYSHLRKLFIDYLGSGLSYQKDSSLQQRVQKSIADSLHQFAQRRRVNEEKTPLVIMAHSFGAVAMQDYVSAMIQSESHGLSAFESMKTMAGFVTCGNPLAIYARHRAHLLQPINVKGQSLPDDFLDRVRWLNFYDKDDIVAYPAGSINEAYQHSVQDISINVGGAATSWNPACHNEYWESKEFCKKVAQYFAELLEPHSVWE